MKNNIVRTLSRTLDNLVLLTLLVCLVFSVYSFWDTHQVYNAADSKKYATYKPTTEEGKMSFAELQAMNSDVIGWLTIYGTSIDYPLVKAQKDNFTYLSKNAEGEWEGSGSIYVDYRNDAHFNDFNTIIHGHHMAEHKMFGDLDLFTNAAYFNEHQYANLYYDGANHGLEIFAILTIDAYDPIAAIPNMQGEEAKQQLLDRILAKQVQGRNISLSTEDHIVVMTTCNLNETNGRYTLVAKLLDHEVANPFPEEETKVQRESRTIDIFSLVDRFVDIPIWEWILILCVAIALTYTLYKLERKRLWKKREKRLANEENRSQSQPNR